MAAFKDLTGKTFGRLSVVSLMSKNPSVWECLCICGTTKQARASLLLSGRTKSCGCLNRDLASDRIKKRCTSHGKARSGVYNSWFNMVSRCTNPDSVSFHNYGAKGVTVCDRWMVFENFFKDMGDRPAGHSLERIKNTEGYHPDNCKWATKKEQSLNKKTTVILKHQEVEDSMQGWAYRMGVPYTTFKRNLRGGAYPWLLTKE